TRVYFPQIEDHATCIAFPYFRDDELINVKYRDRRKNFRMETGAERILYGLADIAETTIIVEGEVDKLSLEQAGYCNVVSVPDGAPSPETKNYASKFSFLESCEKQIARIRNYILAVDNDEPGKRLEDELSRRVGREKCRSVTWPSGCKDANDVLLKHGPDELRRCIDNAQEYPIDGVFTTLDLSDRIEHLYLHGWEMGCVTGWADMDPLYTVMPGQVTVVTGTPNSGKSNWLDALMVNLARMHDWSFAVFSPENQPIHDHMARIIEKAVGAPFAEGKVRTVPRMSHEAMQQARAWAAQHFYWVMPPDDNDWTIEVILDRVRQILFRYGIRGCVIDPWNELEHLRDRSETETEYVGRCLKRIRNFARHVGVHIWIVAHPAKMDRLRDGTYPVPSLYDISGSAHWNNKCDNGIVVWRDRAAAADRVVRDDEVKIYVLKVRWRKIGHIGDATLRYLFPAETYASTDQGDPAIPSIIRRSGPGGGAEGAADGGPPTIEEAYGNFYEPEGGHQHEHL
ncbi:MAG: toprim domain-containing protein, partial [Acidiferrobacteraceae bacterium]